MKGVRQGLNEVSPQAARKLKKRMKRDSEAMYDFQIVFMKFGLSLFQVFSKSKQVSAAAAAAQFEVIGLRN